MDPEISRVTRSKEQARKGYDRLSHWYDRLAHASEWPFTARGLQMLQVQSGETVLEVGCGTGHALVELAGTTGRVYGLDLSGGMLAIARQRLPEAGPAGTVHLVQGDASHLPCSADRFDAVFLSFTLELFDTPEIPVVLGECQRVLHPGGRIGVVSLAKREKAGLMVRLYEWAHRKFPQYVDCRPIYVRPALAGAGFHILDGTETSMWGLPVDIVIAHKEK